MCIKSRIKINLVQLVNGNQLIPVEDATIVGLVERCFYDYLRITEEELGMCRFNREIQLRWGAEGRGYNSQDEYLYFDGFVINPADQGASIPALCDVFSHELVHVVTGGAPGVPFRISPRTIEEGVATFLQTEANYWPQGEEPVVAAYMAARQLIHDAIQNNSNLFSDWRENGFAPILSNVTEDSLREWGIIDNGAIDRLKAKFSQNP